LFALGSDKYGEKDVLPLWVADMDFSMAPEIAEALSERLRHPIVGYTHASERLMSGLRQHLKDEYSWDVDPDWLIWLPGVVPGLSASVRAFAKAKSEIVTNPPIYHHFFQVHDASQHTLVEVPLTIKENRWTYDIDAMRQACNENTSLIMLCSPHNPTGTVFTRDELQEITGIAKSVGAVVVSDEIHCGLVLNEKTPHIPTAVAADDASSIVTLMSSSKTFNLAGANCSYAIIPDEALREQYRASCVEVLPMVGTFGWKVAE